VYWIKRENAKELIGGYVFGSTGKAGTSR